MNRSSEPAVSVVIPCRNEAANIEATLKSVLAQELPPGGMEVLIADGMSEDGTRERIAELTQGVSHVRVIDNPGRIVPTGLNAAIRAARGQIVIRMDAHTVYARDYVRQCVAALAESGAENVGGPCLTRAEGIWERAVGAAFRSPFSVGGARFHDPNYEGHLDTVIYGCWHKETLLRIGLFDEELVRNQDDELNLRLIRAGGQIWQTPRIKSWIRPRSSVTALWKQQFQYGYWKVRVIQKHGRPASLRHLVPVLFTLGVVLGWSGGFIHPVLGVAYGLTLALYFLLSIGFSLRAAVSAGWALFPLLPMIFLVYHLSWGSGFAWGLVKFGLLRRGARAAATMTPVILTNGSRGGSS